MTIRTHACVVVYCDTPDCGPWQDIGEGGTPHFSTRDEAITVLSGEQDGFTFGPDGVFCRTCSCGRRGHVWSDWETRCYAPPGRSFCHTGRSCLTCDATDTQPSNTPPTSTSCP